MSLSEKFYNEKNMKVSSKLNMAKDKENKDKKCAC